jgi:predicted DNA-binding WGR domain protein
MKKHLILKGGNTNKFWTIETREKSYTVTSGKVGTKGTSETKTFKTAEACKAAADKVIKQKVNEGYENTGSGKTEKSTNDKNDYKDRWKKICASTTPSKAMYDHLLFMAETTACKKILQDFTGQVSNIVFDAKKNRLIVEFKSGHIMTGYPPFEGRFDDAVPKSHQEIARYHNQFSLEGSETPIIFYGATKAGKLWTENFEAEFLEESEPELYEQFGSKIDSPIDYHQDFILYHPTIKTKRNEPALCYFSHEGDGLYAPYSDNLGITGVLLRLMAEDVLNTSYFKVAKPEHDEADDEDLVPMRALKLSPPLAAIVGSKELDRAKVVREVNAYVERNKLKDPKTKRIIPDEKIKALGGNPTSLSMIDLAIIINKHMK